jgi:hypothetical protein
MGGRPPSCIIFAGRLHRYAAASPETKWTSRDKRSLRFSANTTALPVLRPPRRPYRISARTMMRRRLAKEKADAKAVRDAEKAVRGVEKAAAQGEAAKAKVKTATQNHRNALARARYAASKLERSKSVINNNALPNRAEISENSEKPSQNGTTESCVCPQCVCRNASSPAT